MPRRNIEASSGDNVVLPCNTSYEVNSGAASDNVDGICRRESGFEWLSNMSGVKIKFGNFFEVPRRDGPVLQYGG